MYFVNIVNNLFTREEKMLMNRNDSLLLIIDVQEHLAPAQESPREVINGCAALLDIAKKLDIPFIVAEQNHNSFGPTMIDLRIVLGDDVTYYEKDTFSCYKNEEIREKIKQSGKKQIIIAGLETHICVMQTALDLQKEGYEVFVVADACSSRNEMQSALGVQRLLHNGVDVVTVEMTIFEWLEHSRSAEFREVWAKRT